MMPMFNDLEISESAYDHVFIRHGLEFYAGILDDILSCSLTELNATFVEIDG